uniref:Hyaluronan-mediated motility receptor n=1 Tax=Ciona intestinalis TaxID=7719 RepID=F6XWF2_CIOIN|nr:hyaluronan-mediated motility receptor [Ciona intestinalis]|eukprot:NP_001007565.1 hyaluronan-mediated motility receptor [Ciona intestinalis]
MSFPRAALKRFNEAKDSGPPPGHYTVKQPEKNLGTFKFEHAGERFKSMESIPDESVQADNNTFTAPVPPITNSKKKLNFSGSENKKPEKRRTPVKSSPNVVSKEKQAYEREIRQLLQQCSDREADIKRHKLEIQRFEGKVSILTKDKISLESNTSLMEKSIAALTKKNEFLIAQCEKEKKKENSELDLKKLKTQILSMKQQSDRDKMKIANLEADLDAARSRIMALRDANKVLEQLNLEIEKHGSDVSVQVERLQGLVDKLREENARLQDEGEDTKLKLTEIQEEFNEKLQCVLQERMKECENKTQAANKQVAELQTNIQDADAKLEELSETVNLLQCEKSDMHAVNVKLQQHISETEQRCETFAAEESERKNELKKRIMEVETAQVEIENLQKELKENKEKHESVLKETDERRAEALEESRALNKKLDALAKCEAELSQEVSNKTSETEQLRGQLESVTSSKNDLAQEVETIKKELGLLRADHMEKSKKLNEVETEKKTLMEQLDDNKHQLERHKEASMTSEAKYLDLEKQFASANQNAMAIKMREEKLRLEVEDARMTWKQEEEGHHEKLKEFTRRILDTQKKLNQRENEVKTLTEELVSIKRAMDDLNDKSNEQCRNSEVEISSLKAKNEQLECDVTKLTEGINELKEAVESKGNADETEKWKTLYEELLEKVKPFQGQLDAYSAEKAMLLSETSAAQAETTRLGLKYAELLGHQNQRQKIKHIVKIKEESVALKQENTKLRNQVSLLTKQVVKSRKPVFDPATAFQHHKENANPN